MCVIDRTAWRDLITRPRSRSKQGAEPELELCLLTPHSVTILSPVLPKFWSFFLLSQGITNMERQTEFTDNEQTVQKCNQ